MAVGGWVGWCVMCSVVTPFEVVVMVKIGMEIRADLPGLVKLAGSW